MGGCDKSTPGLVMGALSAGVPMIFLPAGPMLRGNYAGRILGSGSDAWKYWDERRAGNITDAQWQGIEGGIARSYGTCMTMGTASTMTSITEALGLSLPGASSIPAADSSHIRMSAACGRRIVEMVWEDLTPERIVTDASVRNAAIVAMATGCSTNAVVHLIAMARRGRVKLDPRRPRRAGPHDALIANVRPSGKDYLMEDFYLRRRSAGADGSTWPSGSTSAHSPSPARRSARRWRRRGLQSTTSSGRLSNPVYHEGSLAVLRGNLCPDGAVIKPAACDREVPASTKGRRWSSTATRR